MTSKFVISDCPIEDIIQIFSEEEEAEEEEKEFNKRRSAVIASIIDSL